MVTPVYYDNSCAPRKGSGKHNAIGVQSMNAIEVINSETRFETQSGLNTAREKKAKLISSQMPKAKTQASPVPMSLYCVCHP